MLRRVALLLGGAALALAMTIPAGEAVATSAGKVHSLVDGARTWPVPMSRFTTPGER